MAIQAAEYRSLLAHMEWADALVWRAVLGAAGEDHAILGRLHHFHSTQWAYLQVLEGRPLDVPELEAFPDSRVGVDEPAGARLGKHGGCLTRGPAWVEKPLSSGEDVMTIDEARELFGYSAWANARVFDTAATLTPEQVAATIASSFPSVRETLAHIVGTEWIWLRRWGGENPAAAPAWVAGSGLSELRARLTAVESEREAYLAGLADGDLERVVEYRRLSGEASADRLADLVRHVVNHSTYHRGQLVTQLRQVGVSPPGTDLILYVRSRR